MHTVGIAARNERAGVKESAPSLGRDPPKLSPKQIAHARRLLDDRDTTVKEVAASFGVDRATIYRALGLGATANPNPEVRNPPPIAPNGAAL